MISAEEFLGGMTGRFGDLRLVIQALAATGQPFCFIGDLAVNHYAEPVATLDADFALAAAGSAAAGQVFDIPVPVARLDDLVQGKLWAGGDPRRRQSKRAKDEADILRLAENHPEVLSMIPLGQIPRVDTLRSTD